MSSAARLGSNLLVCKDHCIINLVDLEKHSTTKNIRGYLRIQKFHDDPVLCPVSALVEYHNRVSTVRKDQTSFFVTSIKPHGPASSKTLSRWTLSLLSSSGVDTTIFKSHSTRSASVAFMQRTLSNHEICKVADWSTTSGVYERFYQRYL